jgi:cytochrome c biogenesis protein CcdA/glutaredoxin
MIGGLSVNKRILAVFLLVLVFGSINAFSEENESVQITLYHASFCSYCKKEIQWLEKEFLPENPDVELKKIMIDGSEENYQIFVNQMNELNESSETVPVLIVGEEKVVRGFNENTKKQITDLVEAERNSQQAVAEEELIFELPLIGEINAKKMSLPAMAIFLGLIDGFNPCAMWVLVFLIALLLEVQDKKRIWLIVGTFILASGVLYFLFMTAWLNVFLFIGFMGIIQLIIGVIAIVSGAWHVKDFLKKEDPTCKVVASEEKKKITERIQELVNAEIVPATIIGIILLAFSVNLIEFVCSAGIPAVFTKILAANNLSTIEYYGYILLYDIFYMLDDFIVFMIAAFTLQFIDVGNKYVKWAGLFGGIVLIILGILLIFFPQMLVFA